MDPVMAKYHPHRWKELNDKIKALVEIENSLRPKLEEAERTVEEREAEYQAALRVYEAIKKQLRQIRLERETIITNMQLASKDTSRRKKLL